MATIEEIMRVNKPGEVKICRTNLICKWIQPFFKDINNKWWGLDDEGELICSPHIQDYSDWQLWQEPKRKTMYEVLLAASPEEPANRLGFFVRYYPTESMIPRDGIRTGRTIEVDLP